MPSLTFQAICKTVFKFLYSMSEELRIYWITCCSPKEKSHLVTVIFVRDQYQKFYDTNRKFWELTDPCNVKVASSVNIMLCKRSLLLLIKLNKFSQNTVRLSLSSSNKTWWFPYLYDLNLNYFNKLWTDDLKTPKRCESVFSVILSFPST